MEQELRACKEELDAVKNNAKEAEEAHAEEMESLSEARVRGSYGSSTLDSYTGSSSNDVRSMKEKIARLERQNKKLKEDIESRESGKLGEGGTGSEGKNVSGLGAASNRGGTPSSNDVESLTEQLEDAIRLQKRYEHDSAESTARAEALQVELDLLRSDAAAGGQDAGVSEDVVAKRVKEAVAVAEKSAAARFKSASERLERVKRKHDEQLKMNATLRQSVIELEQRLATCLRNRRGRSNRKLVKHPQML